MVLGEDSIFSKLSALIGHNNITHDIQKDLLCWLLQYFIEVRGLRDTSYAIQSDSPTALQLSNDSKSESEKRRKADMAAKKRTRLMAKMCKMQRDFIKENAALFENASQELPEDGDELMR